MADEDHFQRLAAARAGGPWPSARRWPRSGPGSGPAPCGPLCEGLGVDAEAGEPGQFVQQRSGGLGVRGPGGVVRHARPDADRGDAGLAKSHLEHGLRARRDLHGGRQEADAAGQLFAAGGGRQSDRPRVGDRRRESTRGPLRARRPGGARAPPLPGSTPANARSGSGPARTSRLRPPVSVAASNRSSGQREAAVDPVRDAQDRAPGALVEQGVGSRRWRPPRGGSTRAGR